jgi:hypothetical protein
VDLVFLEEEAMTRTRSRAIEGPYNSFMRPDVPRLLFDIEDGVEMSGVERPAWGGGSIQDIK